MHEHRSQAVNAAHQLHSQALPCYEHQQQSYRWICSCLIPALREHHFCGVQDVARERAVVAIQGRYTTGRGKIIHRCQLTSFYEVWGGSGPVVLYAVVARDNIVDTAQLIAPAMAWLGHQRWQGQKQSVALQVNMKTWGVEVHLQA